MEAFVSGLRGVLLIEVLVSESKNSFGVVRRGSMGLEAAEKDEETSEEREPLLYTLWKERLELKDNTTLGKKLKELSTRFPDAHILLAPPKVKVSEEHISPIIKKLGNHIAVMRESSAVMLNPASQSDLMIDDECYLVIPPNLLANYAEEAPEPLHLLIYAIAILITCVLLAAVHYRMRKNT